MLDAYPHLLAAVLAELYQLQVYCGAGEPIMTRASRASSSSFHIIIGPACTVPPRTGEEGTTKIDILERITNRKKTER